MIPSSISWLIKTAITQLPKQIALIAILTASPTLLQAVDLVNEDVPSTMADGDSTYTLNNGFTKVFTDPVYIGTINDVNNRFSIIEGASASGQYLYLSYLSGLNEMIVSGEGSRWQGYDLAVGMGGSLNVLTVSEGGSIHLTNMSIGTASPRVAEIPLGSANYVLVTGTNSVVNVTDDIGIGFAVWGTYYNNNTNHLRVEDGATFNTGMMTIGQGNATEDNHVYIKGTGTTWTNQGSIHVGSRGASKSLLSITDGAKVFSGGRSPDDKVTIGDVYDAQYASQRCEIVISGERSSLTLKSDLHIGASYSFPLASNHTIDSSLTIENGGLLRMGDSTNANSLVFGGINSAIRINNGYFAWYGDQVSTLQSLILAGNFMIFDGNHWTIATLDNIFLTYLANSTGEAETLGLYSDLNGYTLISTTIPEPSTWALIIISVTGFAVGSFRRRRKLNTTSMFLQ